jgi:hypothetical protein
VPSVPTYHSDDWLRQLERGQAGAAFFRWWWDQNVAPAVGGRVSLFHTGFDPAEVVPVEEKAFLTEGGNLPDFALVRRQDKRAEAGNVIASFSVNLQKEPYNMHSGALAAGCFGCPATSACFARESPRVWVNVYHHRDSERIEERWKAPDFRVTMMLKAPERFRDAIASYALHDSLLNYLRGGLPSVSVPEHAEMLEQLDTIGYKRGSHNLSVSWFPTDDPVFAETSADHWQTLGSSRGAPRKVHCVSLARAQPGDELIANVVRLTANAYAA